MIRLLQYYGKYANARGAFGNLPSWARMLLLLLALPGLIGIAISILAFGLSIVILLLLTMPVFRLLQWTGMRGGSLVSDGPATDFVSVEEPNDQPQSTGPSVTVESVIPDRPRRQVDVRIVE